MKRVLAICFLGASAAAASSGSAQILDDWELLFSDRSYDYLVTPGGFGEVDTREDGVVVRVAVSRMLVRYVADARAAIIANRTNTGADAVGYEAFVSSTWLLNVSSCGDDPVLSVVEVTDYDDRGKVLSRARPALRWLASIPQWNGMASARLVEWVCSRVGTGRVLISRAARH